jgi:hypothetical protein
MRDLVDLLAPWVLSWATAIHLLALTGMVGAAFWCSKTRSVGKFLLASGLIFAVVAIPVVATSSALRSAAASSVWVLSIAAVYVVALGILVAKGARPRTIVGASLPLLLVQIPFSLMSGLVLACVVGHDCL